MTRVTHTHVVALSFFLRCVSCVRRRSFMPECQRCPLRLNASVQGLEDNIRQYSNSPLMVDAVPVCLPEVRALRGSWTTGFANPLNGVVHGCGHPGQDLGAATVHSVTPPRTYCEDLTLSEATAVVRLGSTGSWQ